MNERDKKRAAELIRSEYNAKRSGIACEILQSEIAEEVSAIVKNAGLTADINKLQKARKLVHELQENLSQRATEMRGPKAKKNNRYRSCECGEPYEEILEEIAKQSIAAKRQVKKQIEQLAATERKLLAKIEVATSVDDISKVMKSAGLI